MKIQLLPGVKSKPFFKTKKEYEKWKASYCEAVKDELDRQQIRRMESAEHELPRRLD